MTTDQARRVSNLLLGAAAVAGAVFVLRTPALRRQAWALARAALAGSVPAWLGAEIRRAWADSAGGPLAPDADRRRI
jgi:hypothetical protein